jgi:CRISPR-associated protein Cas2
MPRPCLIAYDIANPKRLVRLHRALKRRATPIQYSVFYAELSRAALVDVAALIESIIDPRKDDVRIYLLPRDGWMRSLGRPATPAGILYTALPLPFRSAAEPSPAADAGALPSHEHAPDEARALRADPHGSGSRSKRRARAIEARMPTGSRKGLLLI